MLLLLELLLLLLLHLFLPLFLQWFKQLQQQKQQQLQQQQHLCLNEKLILIQFNLIWIDFVFWYFYNFVFARNETFFCFSKGSRSKVPIKIAMGIAIAIGFVFLFFSPLWGYPPKREKKWEKQSQWQWQCPCQFWLVLFGTFFQNCLAPSSLAPFALFRYDCTMLGVTRVQQFIPGELVLRY